VTVHSTKNAGTGSVGDNLLVRLASSAVLAAAALAAAWLGGIAFAAFWAAAALAVAWEWTRLVAHADKRAHWLVAGGLYAAITLIAPLMLRAEPDHGLTAVLFLFAVVWPTDAMGYVVGRAIGGPKLWPAVSPNKTWSGAVGGTIAALAAGVAVAAGAGLAFVPIAILAVILSMVAQAGDLLESAVKRRFGAKDSSQLIPGHGGVMDRLDSFIAAALVATAIGLVRGGPYAVARGLLIW
jgi:phosphatidate cytidylyltransferase